MHSDRLGRFELVRRLATGGMAEVYLARVSGLAGFERHVVLKVLRESNTGDESYVEMFLDEARLAAALHHQHIAQVYEVGCAEDGSYFLAMEYVHGETISAVLETSVDRSAKLPLDFALTVVCAAAAGLHHAHEQRGPDGAPLHIVHRDVTPSNVLVGFDGSVKLIDFGIAKAEARRTKTQTGFIKGKVGYMAPEQARGYLVDRRSDVFALGVLLYELTTQERAFLAETQFEMTERIVHGEIDPPSKVVPGYPEDLEAVVMTALELDPDDRFQSAEEMRLALEELARRKKLVLGGPAVSRCLAELFGERPEPWLPPRPITRQRRVTAPAKGKPLFPANNAYQFARGSGAQLPLSDDELQGDPRAASTVDLRPLTLPLPADEPDPTPEIITIPIEVVTPSDGRAMVTPAEGAVVLAPIADLETRPLPARPRTPPRALTPPPLPAWIAQPVIPVAPSPVATPIPPLTLDPADFAPMPRPPIPLPAPVIAPPFGARLTPRPRARRMTGIVALTLALGAMAGLVIGLALVAFEDDAPAPPPPALTPPAAAPRSPATTAPAPAVTTATPTAPTPIATTATPTAPDEVSVRVTSVPAGATVVLDGERLGTTPFTGRVPARKTPGWLKVRLKNHVAVKTKVTLTGADVTWSVRLKPQR